MATQDQERGDRTSPLYTPKDVAAIKKAETYRAADGAYRWGDFTRMPTRNHENKEAA